MSIDIQVKDILDNAEVAIIIGFEKDGAYYVHPLVTDKVHGIHGATLKFTTREEAQDSTNNIIMELECPWFIVGVIDPEHDVFRFQQVVSQDGSGDKDKPWEQSEGRMPIQEFLEIFPAGSEIEPDLEAMTKGQHPPNAVDSDIARVIVDGEQEAGIPKGNAFVRKTGITGIN